MEQILPGLYRLEIPMPKNPLKAVNSYVIIGADKNLIIDTGLNRTECIDAIKAGLSELDIDLSKTDFFATHMHADHSALITILKTPTSKVYASAVDAAGIRSLVRGYAHWQSQEEYAILSGMPPAEAREGVERHPGFKFGPKTIIDFTIVQDQSTLSVGDYNLICLETPGHTSGHICLYDPEKKLLFSGDHVLGDITPNISILSDEGNPLNDYLNSLTKIAALDVKLVLPGHRRLFSDCKTRIKELHEHHRLRNEEIMSILSDSCLNAFSIAARMTWDMTYASFNDFPASQKWFATGETIAHLRYLEGKNLIKRDFQGNQIVYWR